MVVSRVIATDCDGRSEQNTRSIIRRVMTRLVPAERFGITNRHLRGPHRVGREDVVRSPAVAAEQKITVSAVLKMGDAACS